MNYRDYQQVMKLSVNRRKSPSSNSSGSSSCPSTRNASPITSPLSSPRLVPHCSSHDLKDSNYKIQKKTKITRSKTGCLCCRKRRKKCDEVHPKCGGCSRNFLDCCWPETIVSQNYRNEATSNKKAENSDDEVPASFSLNNNIMVIEDGHLITKTGDGDQKFIITRIKSSSVEHIMKEHKVSEFPRAIAIKSLLN